jgi:ssDNA-binding Zn-finger/Zn-ribbon topoisomerase 1
MHDDAPAHTCTKCGHTLWDTEIAAGRWVCARCEHTAFERLRELPALFRNLERLDALMKGSNGAGGIGGTREVPAPLRLGVLSLTANGGVVAQLQAIEDDWRKALHWSMGATRHHADIDGATTFLINQLGWVCSNYPDIDADLRTIGKLHALLKGLETGEPRARVFEVLCAESDCPGRMPITMRDDQATCPACGTDYQRDQLMLLDSQYGPNAERQRQHGTAA